MAKHGSYQGVLGWFADTIKPSNSDEVTKQLGGHDSAGAQGLGGRDD